MLPKPKCQHSSCSQMRRQTYLGQSWLTIKPTKRIKVGKEWALTFWWQHRLNFPTKAFKLPWVQKKCMLLNWTKKSINDGLPTRPQGKLQNKKRIRNMASISTFFTYFLVIKGHILDKNYCPDYLCANAIIAKSSYKCSDLNLSSNAEWNSNLWKTCKFNNDDR